MLHLGLISCLYAIARDYPHCQSTILQTLISDYIYTYGDIFATRRPLRLTLILFRLSLLDEHSVLLIVA